MQDLTKLKLTIEAGLTDSAKEVFESVSKLECIKDLFLCGGTGISVQLNHRLSEDLDFELIGTRKERPQLDFGGIIREIKGVFPDAQEELLGSDHFLVFINDRNVFNKPDEQRELVHSVVTREGGMKSKVKLSFFRPENPVKTMEVGIKYNNLKTPTLQDSLGMKVYALCVRSVFRDYYDIYSLLESGQKLEEAISYASYLSRHQIRSKVMYSKMLSPQLFRKEEEFNSMSPRYDVTADEIRDRIKQAIESENLGAKADIK